MKHPSGQCAVDAGPAVDESTGATADPPPAPPPPRPPAWRVWAVDTALAAAFTAGLILWSMHWGRLALPPEYDDSAYLAQALRWVVIYEQGGWRGVFDTYREDPAHAPLTDLPAALGFALFGSYDFVPYATRFIIVLMLLRIVRRLLAPLPAAGRWALTAGVLCTPLVGTLVTEYRPDPVYSLLLAASMLYILSEPLARAGLRRQLVAGLAFAVVLLVKTTTYPQTLAFMAGALGLRMMLDALERDGRPPARRILAAPLVVFATALLLAAPHYALAVGEINYYIRITLFGARKDLWALTGDLGDHLGFYLIGRGASVTMGWRLFIWAALLAMSAVFAVRMPAGRRGQVAAVLVVLLATFSLPALNRTKTYFLGMTFHFTLLLSALWMAGRAWRWAQERPSTGGGRTSLGRLALIGGVAAAVAGVPWPDFPPTQPWPVDQRRKIAQALFEAIRPYYLKPPVPRLALTASGTLISPDLFRYLAAKHDRVLLDTAPNQFFDDLDEHRRAIAAADLVIAGESGNGEAWPAYASSQAQDRTLALVRQDPELIEVASVRAFSGKRYFVFARPDRVAGPFDGFESAEGLSPLAPAYPEHRLPETRSGLAGRTILRFQAERDRPMRLVLDGMCPPPVQTMTVRVNDVEVASGLAFDAIYQWRRWVVPLTARAGENVITIDYSHSSDDPAKKLVLFRRIQIVGEATERRSDEGGQTERRRDKVTKGRIPEL